MFYSILCEWAALVLFFSDAPLVFSRYSTSWRLLSIRVGVVIYELPSLLDHDHIYSFNEKDPLQCPFGLEVSHLYYKFLQQGNNICIMDSMMPKIEICKK